MAISPVFQHASPWRTLPLLVFDRQCFVNAAVNHGMAVNLESPDLLSKHKAGTFPTQGWEIEAEATISRSTDKLRQALWSSFIAVLVVTLIAIVITYSAGLLAPSLPIAVGKLTGAIGGFLAGWATLFALGTPTETYDGRTLPELVHPKVFTALFIPGLFFAFIGQLW